jgi:hypothetical protein
MWIADLPVKALASTCFLSVTNIKLHDSSNANFLPFFGQVGMCRRSRCK